MNKNENNKNIGIAILPIQKLNDFSDFIEYTQAHAETLLDEVLTIKEVLKNRNAEIQIIKSASD